MQSEEADTHMFVHIMYGSFTGSQTIIIDINVVVLYIAGILI